MISIPILRQSSLVKAIGVFFCAIILALIIAPIVSARDPILGNDGSVLFPVIKIKLDDPDITDAEVIGTPRNGDDDFTRSQFIDGFYWLDDDSIDTNLGGCDSNSTNNQIDIKVKRNGTQIASGFVNLCDADDDGYVFLDLSGGDPDKGTLTVKYNYRCFYNNQTSNLNPPNTEYKLTGPNGFERTGEYEPGGLTFRDIPPGTYRLKMVHEDTFSGPGNDLANEVVIGEDAEKIGFMEEKCEGRYKDVRSGIEVVAGRTKDLGTITLEDCAGIPTPGFPGGTECIAPPGPAPESPKTCDEQFNFTGGFIVCFVLGIVDSSVDTMVNAIADMLSVGRAELNDDGLKEAWSYFRNIASVLLVVIGLVMIIGQAVSKE